MHSKIERLKLSLLVPLLCIPFLGGCSHAKPSGDAGPIGKISSIADGGAYFEQSRGDFEIGDNVVIFKRECREVPVRGGPMRNCSTLEYGEGRIERRLEDGHFFVRSDAVSMPEGAFVKRLPQSK